MALVHLTHRYLPGMQARNAGHILYVGSVASFIPGPDYAVYSAAKAFVLSFSEALAEELRKTKIGVTCLCPGPVDTGFADRAEVNASLVFKYFPMSPQAVAAAGIKALKNNKRVFVPGLISKLIVFLYQFAPRRLVIRLARKVMEKQN
jgi:short-subunit dehydrogenase